MKIGIDARNLLTKHYTGIARYIYENIHAWARLYPQHEFYLFSPKRLHLELKLPPNWHIIDDTKTTNGKIWFLLELPALVKKYNVDVFWGPSFTLPRKNDKTKYFVTVHDLALFKFKGIGELKNTIRVKGLTKRACKSADGIITISKTTAEDVHELLGIPKEKIYVSYIGGLPSTFSPEYGCDKTKVNPVLQFEEDYFLFISTIEPRKNVLTIIKAFELYKEKTKSSMKLVLAGKKGWRCEPIYQAVENSRYCNDIIMPGFISDDDKAYLLSNACAFVFPSLYEGFGIPILEAFAYDVPVITANVSSMPEVAGNAAFYVNDPFDIDALSQQMLNVSTLSNEDKRRLSDKMKMRLQMFSWDKNAKEIMEIMSKDST